MTKRLDPEKHSWMTAEPTCAVMAALTKHGGEARFVGGAVRNALIGAKVDEVDIATPLTPDEVTRRLEAAGLSAVPTGIEHGTVTAIAFGRPFEVTTLRRDVSTDGRRAVVAFTKDWNEDAQRRDFTMNALYASADGALFDSVGGVADLEKGRVRFIGDAAARIREDYLRILRLFRFHAWYGKGPLDESAMAAAAAGKAGLAQLSGERIQKEMLKLLAAPDPMPVLLEMAARGILIEVLPEPLRLERLGRLIAIDRENGFAPDAPLRLAALLRSERETVQCIAERWRLSNADRDRLLNTVAHRDMKLGAAPRRLLYRLGENQFRDLVRLHWTEGDTGDWRALLALADNYARPMFPLDGRDVMAAGLEEGPRVGQVLAELETFWIEHDFKPTRDALLARLKELVKKGLPQGEG
jgi:poly(A) polymerase